MHLTFLRHAGLAAARILMMAAWFGLSVWAAGVVFYNVWGGPVLVWLYVAAMACAFALRRKRPVLWRASWGVPALLLAYYLCAYRRRTIRNGSRPGVACPPWKSTEMKSW